MPRFQIRALTPDGTVQENELHAASEQAVHEQLNNTGHVLLHIQTARTPQRHTRNKRLRLAVEHFTQELSYLLSAGVALEKALTLLHNQPQLSRQLPLAALLDQLREGQRFSAALAHWPTLFDPLYISMVQTAETTGDLAGGLQTLHQYQQQHRQLQETLSSAMIYPATLAIVSLLSILTILLFVIPQFADLLSDIQATLPLHTQWILIASETLRSQGHWYGLGLAVGLLSLQWLLRSNALRPQYEQLQLRLPLAGTLLIHTEMARFCRSLGTLLSRGVPMLEALDIARQTLQRQAFQHSFATLSQQLRDGQPLAAALAHAPQVPEIMVQLVQVGEETGQTGTMLLRLAELFERQSHNRLRKLISLLEPLLIISLGLVIAVLVLSMLSAVLSLNNISL